MGWMDSIRQLRSDKSRSISLFRITQRLPVREVTATRVTIQETAFNNELKRQETEGPPTRGGGGGVRGRGQQN